MLDLKSRLLSILIRAFLISSFQCSFAQVIVHEGGTVKLENGASIKTKETGLAVLVNGSPTDAASAGSLIMSGECHLPVAIHANGEPIIINGKFTGTYFIVNKPHAEGVKFERNGAAGFVPQINQFDHATFDNAPMGGNYITFAKVPGAANDLSAALTFSFCTFNNSSSNLALHNVKLAENYAVNGSTTNLLYFLDSSGPLSGELFDDDPTDTTINRVRWALDNVPPTAKIVINPSPPITAPQTISITLTTSEAVQPPTLTLTPQGGSPLPIALSNSGDLVTWTGTLAISGATGNGTATFNWQATDFAGNVGTEIYQGKAFTIDISPPTAQITIDPHAPILYSSTFSVTLKSSEPLQPTPSLTFTPFQQSPIAIALSSADNITWTGSMPITPTTGDGIAQFQWQGIDLYGNSGSAITAGEFFEIDVVHEVVVDLQGANLILTSNAVFNGTFINANVLVVPSGITISASGSADIAASEVAISGTNFGVSIFATDAPVLLSPPNHTDPIFFPDVGSSAIFAYQSKPAATSYFFEISSTPDFSGIVASGSTTATAFTVNFTASGSYYWHVKWTDGSYTSLFSVTWRVDVDAQPPATPQNLTALGENEKIDLFWNLVTSPDLAGYNVYSAPLPSGPFDTLENSSLITGTTFTDILVGGGTRSYVVRAVDVFANQSPPSNVASGTASESPPAAPVILASDNKKTNDNTPVINGIAEANTTVTVYYNDTNVLGTTTASASGIWTLHNITLVLLDGSYIITAKASYAPANQSSTSNSVTLTIDTVAPGVPTNVQATALNSAAYITWTPPPDTDVLGYNVYRKIQSEPDSAYVQINSKLIADTAYKDETAQNGNQYCYKVAAVDDAANEKHSP